MTRRAEITHRESPWLRFSSLPLAARALAVALLACAAAPAVGALLELGGNSALVGALGAHPRAVSLASCVVSAAALLAFERPRSPSPVAYARQLRARFLELQSTFDAGFRRRPRGGEGEGK